ncbi:MAG: PEP-CTERM sorting domain-containing protein [Bryobacterales bacterium]|nr:PEP-CTERM sorting domain-containing protein [Bryobacterales bacterium]
MKKFFLGLALSGLLAFNASATQITDSFVGGTISAGTDFTATLNQFLSVPGLPALAPGEVYVLNWWQLSIETEAISEIARAENLSSNPAVISANVNVGALFNGTDTGNPNAPAAGSFGGNANLAFGPFNATASDGNLDFLGTSGVTFTPPSITSSVGSGSSAQIFNLTGVVGPGTFNVFIDASDLSAFSAGGSVLQQLQTNQRTTVRVLYDFDVRCEDQGLCGGGNNNVPEPTSMALMGIGLVGLGFFGRRLRK